MAAANVPAPNDRVIDGINQLDWLTGSTASSNRDGYIYWMGPEMFGVRWRNFKLVLVEQKYVTDPPLRLTTAGIINLTDPHERERYSLPPPTHLGRLALQRPHRRFPKQHPNRNP